MTTYCESIARNILPLYRAFVAKELIEKYGYTQVLAAKKLGITQAAISQYVTSKRGQKGTANDKITPSIQAAAVKMAKQLNQNEVSTEEFGAAFCELCEHLRNALYFNLVTEKLRASNKITVDYQI